MSLSTYFKTNILKMGLYGFICGMSLLLSGNTLNFWLASSSIDIKIVSLFAWVALPYSLKYFLAILIDKYRIPILSKLIGSHKAWLLLSQLMLVCLLILLSFLNPHKSLFSIAVIAFFIALFAVIQDIVLNGYRISILKQEEQSHGTSVYTAGYRIGMIFSGAGIVFSSAFINWSAIYLVMATVYLVLIFIMSYTFINNDNNNNIAWTNKGFFKNTITKPIEYFGGYRNTIWILFFIILYLLSDNMLMIMLNPFLLGQGYDAIEIASISKAFGTIMVIVGGLVGGEIMNKIGLRRSLLLFCAINMLGHPFFLILYYFGKSSILLYLITGYNAFTGGLITVVYIMFISKLSEGKYAATIYALLSSAMGLSRILFPSISGFIVDSYGWVAFFISLSIVSIISLVFCKSIPQEIFKLYKINN